MIVRLEKRSAVPAWIRAVIPLGACCVALAISGAILAASGIDPISTYRSMWSAAFTSPGGFSGTLDDATPLLLTGLCALLAFRIGVYNIGGEGQLYLGATAASGVGLALGREPRPLVITMMIVAGAVGGGLWAAIPAVLRAYLRANEILTTLMFNYIAGLLITYLIFNSDSYWRDLTSPGSKVYPVGKMLPASGSWPTLRLGSAIIPFGAILGLGLALCAAAAFRRSHFGFQMRVLFDSPESGRYAGINTRGLILGVMLGSGALAGIAGASQIGDFGHLLDPTGLQSAQFGYTGIVVAALAALDPIALVLSSAFLGALTNASFELQGLGFPNGLVGTTEGILLGCVIASYFLVIYRLRLGSRGSVIKPVGAAMKANAEKPREATPELVAQTLSQQDISR